MPRVAVCQGTALGAIHLPKTLEPKLRQERHVYRNAATANGRPLKQQPANHPT